ncbi:hypothetical protein SR870_12555 [Rhodopseudomonas palustris]|uniref:hypothetical protein n=1 Tax=Rhodopseudomonas palustris TaxID=1076 RepID=UPI002ACE0CA8|nr:hypothetical protein [Rhodopseudomonas palustris]WQG97550.1 hypothetical protein SR870_12555 [Rhodopseudomonas palustris]
MADLDWHRLRMELTAALHRRPGAADAEADQGQSGSAVAKDDSDLLLEHIAMALADRSDRET